MARRSNTSSAYHLYESEPVGMVRRAERKTIKKNQITKHPSTEQRRELVSAKRKAASGWISGRLIGNVLLVCLFAFVVVFRYSAIVEKDHALTALKEERNAIADENKRLQVAIDSALNLENVERIAESELGMGKPEKYQTVYVTVQGDDYVEVAEDTENDTTEGKQFYATMIQTLGNVLEYLY